MYISLSFRRVPLRHVRMKSNPNSSFYIRCQKCQESCFALAVAVKTRLQTFPMPRKYKQYLSGNYLLEVVSRKRRFICKQKLHCLTFAKQNPITLFRKAMYSHLFTPTSITTITYRIRILNGTIVELNGYL